jgi:hypothetical protein
MTEKKRRPAKKRPAGNPKSPYFLQPARQGSVTVFRRPAGNRIDPKLCGTMASRAMALALVKQLEKAESVVRDLFLEATDDGIEALEAVLEACRQSVIRRGESGPLNQGGPGGGGASGARRRGRGRRRGPPRPAEGQKPPSPPPMNEGGESGERDTSAA